MESTADWSTAENPALWGPALYSSSWGPMSGPQWCWLPTWYEQRQQRKLGKASGGTQTSPMGQALASLWGGGVQSLLKKTSAGRNPTGASSSTGAQADHSLPCCPPAAKNTCLNFINGASLRSSQSIRLFGGRAQCRASAQPVLGGKLLCT